MARLPQSREDRVKERYSGCVHFRGTMHDTCRAGVDMKTLAEVEKLGVCGWALRLPCTGNRLARLREESKQPRFHCPKFQPYTQEDIDKQEAETAEMISSMRTTIPLIALAKRNAKTKQEWETVFECPTCHRGKLTITVSKHNFHTRGTCSTPECTRWIE